MKLKSIYTKCRKSNSVFLLTLFSYYRDKFLYGKKVLRHHKVTVGNIRNIESSALLEIGMGKIGFSHKNDRTFLNLQGKLKIAGPYSIGRGCRFDIAKNAVMKVGKGGYINVNSTFIIMHGLTIGDECVISWDCQFLDEDFHKIDYQGKKEAPNEIIIGNHVWIGCGVKIYKGTVIPDGSVIAANSVVRGVFTTPGSLIGGHPARVLREGVYWI